MKDLKDVRVVTDELNAAKTKEDLQSWWSKTAAPYIMEVERQRNDALNDLAVLRAEKKQ